MTFLSLNVGNFITLKLSPTNYPLWREQALALVESQELLGHLTNEDPAPPQYTILDSNNTPTVETQQVTYLRKEDDKTIGEHIRTFKSLCNSLAAIGKPVPDKEKVFYLLTSLGPQYETFTTTMLKPPRPSYSELVSQLQSLDQRRNWFSNHANATHALTPQMAFYGQQQQRYPQSSTGYQGNKQTFTSIGRGFQAQQSKNQNRGYFPSPTSSTQQRRPPPPPRKRRMTPAKRDLYHEEKCQYYGMVGHIAKICWWVPKRPTQQDDIPQALAALTLDNTIVDTEWTSTGASNHMTIKVFHLDGRGEFINFKLSSHFLSTELYIGIMSIHSEQTELGMTMLFHSGAPLFLWVETFSTTVYLINRLPSSTLNSETPYFALHGTHPDYTSLPLHFDSWLPHTNSTHNVEIESQTLTPPCTSHLPAIPLLTSVSNTVTGSSSNMIGNDILLTGSSIALVSTFIQLLSSKFAMKDLGQIHYFLGIEISQTYDGLHLSQSHYALTILERANMVDCKPMSTTLEAKTRTSSNDVLLEDLSYFRGLVGALQYLTLTRPDLSYSVNFASQFMHAPTVVHLKMVRRILRYVKGTIDIDLHFTSNTTLDICAFSDADWAGCRTTRRSITGYYTFLGGNLISSSAEVTWMSFILQDLHISLAFTPTLYCDNTSALHMTINLVFHARSKHIELDYHFVSERVALGLLVTQHISP
ncbi:hypothetical protein AAG906_039189 [Vitis piasezkii]